MHRLQLELLEGNFLQFISFSVMFGAGTYDQDTGPKALMFCSFVDQLTVNTNLVFRLFARLHLNTSCFGVINAVCFFCFRRKWLPPPLRKLSQGKVEKSGAPDRPPLKKTPSDKKVSVEMGNKQGGGEEEASGRLENGEEGEEDVELPPPMKPIQEPLIVPSDEASGDGVRHHIYKIVMWLYFSTFLRSLNFNSHRPAVPKLFSVSKILTTYERLTIRHVLTIQI